MANFKLTENQRLRLVKENYTYIYLKDDGIKQCMGDSETSINSMVGDEGVKSFTNPTITDKVQNIQGPRFTSFKRKI